MAKIQNQRIGVSFPSSPLPEKDKGKHFTVDLYVRVSTFSQLEGDSLEEQESELRKFCDYRGFKIHRIYCEEAKSGGNTRRPEYQKLISDIENRKVDAVVVKKLDRLSRSLLDFEQLMVLMQRHEVEFMSLRENFDTTTAMGKAMLRMALVFAQLEREQTAERISDVMQYRASQGLRNGGTPPFGYRVVEKTLVPYSKEKEVVELVFKQYLVTHSTLSVARFLADLGLKNRQNKPWDCRRILDMLQNPTYKGDHRWKGQVFPGTHVPIISAQTFEQVQNFIRRRGALNKSEALLQKLLFCGHCNKPMTPSYAINHSKIRYYYYLCLNPQGNTATAKASCPFKRVAFHVVEDPIIAYLASLASDIPFRPIGNRIQMHNDAITQKELTMATAIAQLNDEIVKLKVKKDRYFDMLMTQTLLSQERKMGTERLNEIDSEIRQLQAALHKKEFEKASLSETKIESTEFRFDLAEFTNKHANYDRKHLHIALKHFIKDIYFHDSHLTMSLKSLPWSVDIPLPKHPP